MVSDTFRDGGISVLQIDIGERDVLLHALDRYLAALAALKALDGREGKSSESDQIAAIATGLRDRIDHVTP